jgi:hypothetical protein
VEFFHFLKIKDQVIVETLPRGRYYVGSSDGYNIFVIHRETYTEENQIAWYSCEASKLVAQDFIDDIMRLACEKNLCVAA